MTENLTTSEQHSNLFNELHFSYLAEFIEDAEDLFIEAKDKLFDVNNWGKMGNLGGTRFILTDAHKKEVRRKTHIGDLIKIEKENKTYWFDVVAVEYDDYPDENKELFTICMKPIQFEEKLMADDQMISLSIERINAKLFSYGYIINQNKTYNIENQLVSTITSHTLPVLSTEEWGLLLKCFIKF